MANLKSRDFYPDFHIIIRKDGRVNGVKPVTLKDMGLPYDLDYPEQPVGELPKELYENLVEEFIFLIDELLPRDIQDLFYKVTLAPRRAYWKLFEEAARRMQLPYYLNCHRDEAKGCYPNIADGIRDFIYEGRTLADIYLNTCVTRQMILEDIDYDYTGLAFSDDVNEDLLCPAEFALFKMSIYNYKRDAVIPGSEMKGTLVLFSKESEPELVMMEMPEEPDYVPLWDDGFDPDDEEKINNLKEEYKKKIEKIKCVEDFCVEHKIPFLKFTKYQAMSFYEAGELGPVLKNSINNTAYAKEFLLHMDDEMVRTATCRDDLFVFDGCPERIDHLKIEYKRETRIKPKVIPEDAEYEFVTWNYSEILTIDRPTETLTNYIQFAEQCSVTNTYHVEEGISSLLDDLWPEMFDEVTGNPPDVIDDPMEQRKYKITVLTNQGKERVIEGTFDKLGLPDEYPEFIEKMYDFMAFYGIGELFSEASYGKAKRTSKDFIFCDVEFEPGGKRYCYLADDDSYEVGDTVLVPAGHHNHEALVRIVDKNYYSSQDAPFPVEKAKHITKRIDEDKIDDA